MSDATLPGNIAGPAYDRSKLRTGIVHLGIGAFHRAHQAVYTEAVLASGDLAWGIVGASLRSPDTRDALAPQDNLYTLIERGEHERLQIIGSVRNILVAPENPEALIAQLADPGVRIASLTVTEKAYRLDPATRALDATHPDIISDLANPQTPRSALGFLAAGLARRRAAGIPPFTVLCCDNLPSNGRTVHAALAAFADHISPEFGAYIRTEIACPDTMVDRIVPATTDADRAGLRQAAGYDDAWPVLAEPFTQWVIEDHFPTGRPAWDIAGAQFVTDVAPFEAMKLRLLNAAHSAIAYLGYLMGCETVAQAMRIPELVRFIARLMDDATSTLSLPPGTDVEGYKRALLHRFANPALAHRTWQIAMDGSQKLPQRLLATIRDRRAENLDIHHHALAVAAWMRYAAGTDEHGAPIDVRDPLADQFKRCHTADDFLSLGTIFPADLRDDPVFRSVVTAAFVRLHEVGARAAVAELV